MAPLASPANLTALDLGGGDVRLVWTYPIDIVAASIVFDVFGSTDPLEPLRTAFATGVAALQSTLAGLGLSGSFYFSVVARRGDLLSLPSRLVALSVKGPSLPMALTPGTTAASPSSLFGLGFPFGITGTGGVYAQGGDPLLRGKILQLLLTVPGERVNLPDYGTRLLDMVFDPNSDVLAATTQFTVTRALQKFLGDEIQVADVQISADEATLNVDVSYVKKADLVSQQVRIGVPLPEVGSL